MDPNRAPLDACDNIVDNCETAYNDYHRFISNNFGNKFMLNSSFEQG